MNKFKSDNGYLPDSEIKKRLSFWRNYDGNKEINKQIKKEIHNGTRTQNILLMLSRNPEITLEIKKYVATTDNWDKQFFFEFVGPEIKKRFNSSLSINWNNIPKNILIPDFKEFCYITKYYLL